MLSEEGGGTSRLRVFSAAASGSAPSSWQLHAQVALRPARLARVAQYLDLDALRTERRHRIDGETIYRTLASVGLDYGTSYQWLARAELGSGDALAPMVAERAAALTPTASWAPGLAPELLDACLQLLVVTAGSASAADAFTLPGSGYLPVRIEAVRQRGEINKGRIFYAQLRAPAASAPGGATDDCLLGDVWLLSDRGEVLLEVVGVTAQPLRTRPPRPAQWQLAWRAQPLASPHSEPERLIQKEGYFLLLGAADGVAAALGEQLQRAGRRCIQVRPGAAFARHAADSFALEPSAAADWQQLTQHLAQQSDGPCAGVVYLLGLDGNDRLEPSPKEYPATLAGGCLGILHWLQAHSQRDDARLDEGLLVVTRAARAVTAGEATRPLQALLWGFAGVVASEHPELRVRRIDLEDQVADPQAVAALLFRELVSREPAAAIAWRGQRYVARLIPALPAAPPAAVAVTIHGDATYLVTGGLSGLGLAVAQWLADQGARRLLLIARRAPVDASVAAIAQLRRRGVEVIVGQADVADATALSRTLAAAASAAYPLRGIIHSAAVLEDSTLLKLQPEQLRRVLAPKVLGALNLQRLTVAAELDFFTLFSSVAATLGNPGQSSYCAANSFLDSLAESRLAHGQRSLSIAWGPWAATGLLRREELGERLAERGLPGLSREAGMRAFAQLLRTGSATCCPIVATLDVERWLQATAGASAALLRELSSRAISREPSAPSAPAAAPSASTGTARLRDTVLALPAAERPPRLLEALRELVGKILRATPQKRSQLGAELPLTRLGLDSLMAIELRNRIDAELGVNVPLSLVMQNGTLAAIAARVLQELPATPAAAPPPTVWDEGDL